MLLKFSPQITEHAKDGKGFLIMEPVLSEKELGNKCEMYPLYWTPSKEGTFCVIRLNLS
jgi:hypothetical protein